MVAYGKQEFEFILQPVTGKAVPVYKGEVLRITLIEGPQCVDFNCFNLHDYKEHMSIGHMRRPGFRFRRGDMVWSNPPRYNPMMVASYMADTCLTDLIASRCQAALFEKHGFKSTHTNCQDTFAETIGEYGLTPDDVHDSLNFWMNTGWDNFGSFFPTIQRNPGKKGDYVDLLALMDVLAVPIVCGSGDVFNTSNFWLKPLKIEKFGRSEETQRIVQAYLNKHTGLKNQRRVEDFRIRNILANRELKPIPGYEPHFVNFPLIPKSFTIDLSDAEYKQVKYLQERGLGSDDEDAVRSAVMTWIMRALAPQIVSSRQNLPNRILFDVD